jgi:hypothetical protein
MLERKQLQACMLRDAPDPHTLHEVCPEYKPPGWVEDQEAAEEDDQQGLEPLPDKQLVQDLAALVKDGKMSEQELLQFLEQEAAQPAGGARRLPGAAPPGITAAAEPAEPDEDVTPAKSQEPAAAPSTSTDAGSSTSEQHKSAAAAAGAIVRQMQQQPALPPQQQQQQQQLLPGPVKHTVVETVVTGWVPTSQLVATPRGLVPVQSLQPVYGQVLKQVGRLGGHDMVCQR